MRPTGWLFVFSGLIMLGSLLPWVDTVAGSFPGYQGAGIWTLSAGGIVFAGALLHSLWHRRWVTVTHAVLGGGLALGLAGWQAVRLLRLCGAGACAPGVGLVLVLVGSVGVLLAAGRFAGVGGVAAG